MIHSCLSCRSQWFIQRKLPNLNGYSNTRYDTTFVVSAFLANVDVVAGCKGNVCEVIDVLKAAKTAEAAGAAVTSITLTELSCHGSVTLTALKCIAFGT